MALLEFEQDADAVVLTASRGLSEFDYEELEEEAQHVVDALTAMDDPKVVVDLHKTDYFTSSVLAVFLKISRIAGGRLALCALSERATEILLLTKLDRLWSAYASREEALRGLQNCHGIP